MDIQTSTSDWALKIESKGFTRTYERSELDEEKVLCVDGSFSETEKILLTYRLDENERTCRLFIPKCKDNIKIEDPDDNCIFAYSWTPLNFAGIFEPVFKIKTKDNKDKNYTLRLDVLSKFDEDKNQLLKRFLTQITMCSKLVEKRFEQEIRELETSQKQKEKKAKKSNYNSKFY